MALNIANQKNTVRPVSGIKTNKGRSCGHSVKYNDMMICMLDIIKIGMACGDNPVELLDRICMAVGGVQFYLPKFDGRNKLIKAALKQGETPENLAVMYGLTPKAILTISQFRY